MDNTDFFVNIYDRFIKIKSKETLFLEKTIVLIKY